MGVKKKKKSNDKTRRYLGTFKVLLGSRLQFAKSFRRESGCEWLRMGSGSGRECVGARSSESPGVLTYPRTLWNPVPLLAIYRWGETSSSPCAEPPLPILSFLL